MGWFKVMVLLFGLMWVGLRLSFCVIVKVCDVKVLFDLIILKFVIDNLVWVSRV